MHRISIRGISVVTAVALSLATLGVTEAAFAAPEQPMVDSTPVSPLTTQQADLRQAVTAAERAQVAAARAAVVKATAEKAAAKKAAAKKAAAKKAAAKKAAAKEAARKAAAARATRSYAPVRRGSNRALGQQMAANRGWTGAQFGCLDRLWSRESGWSHRAGNASGAYGIPQALPGRKMASAGADWATNPRTQIAWGLSYIGGRYGSPCGAWNAFQTKGWY